jgi:pSer/pThr/pTyr-binding forkhead associated (FHA) protein
MIVKLIESGSEPGQKREILVTKDEFLIGRGADCDLCLHLGEVSRHHCLIRSRGEELMVLDLGSSNGTFVNQQRVRSQAALHDSDVLCIGNFTFMVQVGDRSGISWGAATEEDEKRKTIRLADLPRTHPSGPESAEGQPPGKQE